VVITPIDSPLRPYQNEVSYAALRSEQLSAGFGSVDRDLVAELAALGAEGREHYGKDIVSEVARYTRRVVEKGLHSSADIIHAHDWMTFPAAAAIKRLTGKPLVVHVHSLEVDRAGGKGDPRIEAIERRGLEEADIVIAVSFYSRAIIHQHYGIPLDKIFVVHNGVYTPEITQPYRRARGWPTRVVLFLGRITQQKGPEYFVEAAAKVIPQVADALFVMAGTGDMLPRMIERVKQLGLTENFYFPGFLRGQEVEQIFSLADLYVMPSVSEPFGIAALEALSFETPVIISRQSGVAEVLKSALTVDFWDTNRLADLIVDALLHDDVRREMVERSREELRRVRWDAAATKTIDLYRMLV
jgi:glycosyltransferase involved in cell wall biosynthesis